MNTANGLVIFVVDSKAAENYEENWFGDATAYVGLDEEWEYVDGKPTPKSSDDEPADD